MNKKTRSHGCPYLDGRRYCTHKRKNGQVTKKRAECGYCNAEDCKTYIHSKSAAKVRKKRSKHLKKVPYDSPEKIMISQLNNLNGDN